jgi:signal transduction histidine kinase
MKKPAKQGAVSTEDDKVKARAHPSRHRPTHSSTRFPIVGIGASAGGLEAFTLLLHGLPPDTGMGFVLAQHLDPVRESSLTGLLARATSLPVREVTNDLRVQPNHVYVIPPNTNLSIANGILKLQRRTETAGAHRSVDFFFESLAQDQHEYAIGVILSGTATDGTLGLEAIKTEGGITFAQDESARDDSMPRSAIAAGCVDFVLSPQKIAKELAHIAQHPLAARPARGVDEVGRDEETSRAAFGDLQGKGFIRYDDLPLETKTGPRREVEMVSNLYQEEGEETIQCNIREITERKEAQGALRESENRYRALFDLGPVAIYSCNASGVIREFNHRAAELWGRAPACGDTDERFCGSFKLHRSDGTFMAHPECPMAEVLCGKIPVTRDAEVIIERPDGSRITVIVNIRPLKNEQGEITGAINCFYDVTERKRSERELHDAKVQLQDHAQHLETLVQERTAALHETVHELEAFSYSMAHDLRAPLRAMNGFAQLLTENYAGQLDDRGRDYLQRISTGAERLDRLIQEVLSYAHLVRAQTALARIDLHKLVHGIIRTQPDWQPDRAEIQIEGTLPPVLGQVGLLTQCISNLLGNAIKFVAPGVTPRIRIWAEPSTLNSQPSIKVFFQDNGIGIALEHHDRIFRMFERLRPAAEYEGTGMGLAIVRKAVERMHGRLDFESEPGRGSTFWIELQRVEV